MWPAKAGHLQAHHEVQLGVQLRSVLRQAVLPAGRAAEALVVAVGILVVIVALAVAAARRRRRCVVVGAEHGAPAHARIASRRAVARFRRSIVLVAPRLIIIIRELAVVLAIRAVRVVIRSGVAGA